MKRVISTVMIALLLLTVAMQNINANTCDGVYHDGDASNSWFGDAWDDVWDLDWEAEAKVCYTSMEVSLTQGSAKLVASGEVAGCVGGNGSCCEALCSSGGGAWSNG